MPQAKTGVQMLHLRIISGDKIPLPQEKITLQHPRWVSSIDFFTIQNFTTKAIQLPSNTAQSFCIPLFEPECYKGKGLSRDVFDLLHYDFEATHSNFLHPFHMVSTSPPLKKNH